MIQVIKISDTEYYTGGSKQFLFRDRKEVIVDGETYYKDVFEDKVIYLSEAFKSNDKYPWRKYETDFLHLFSLPEISFYTYYECFRDCSMYNLSTNNWIAVMQLLSELNLLPYKLYSITSIGSRITKNKFPVIVANYGWNNTIGFKLPYQDIIKYKIKRENILVNYYMPERFLRFFPKTWEGINETDLLIDFINELSYNLVD